MATTTRAARTMVRQADVSWNVNRVLVMAGGACTVLAMLAFSGWDPVKTAATLPQFAPAFPGLLLTVVLAFYARPWVYLTAGLLSALMPVMVVFVFGAAGMLLAPLGGGEYQAVLLLFLGLVLSLTGGVSGFVQGRRHAHTPLAEATGSAKALVMAALVVLSLGMLVTSGLAGSQAKEVAAGSYDVAPDVTVDLRTQDFQFSPREVTVPSGKLVELRITNADSAPHTFTYETGGRTYNHHLLADGEARILMRFDAPQTVRFWCAPHSEGAGDAAPDSMTGTLVVT